MLRTRDKSRAETVIGYETQYLPTGALEWGPLSKSSSVVSPDVMIDVVTKGFAAHSARGGIVNSPMSRHVGSRTVLPAQGSLQDVYGVRYVWSGQFRVEGGLPDPLENAAVKAKIDHLEALAVTDAYADVGSPDVATLTELAEFRETLAFLASPVKRMVTLTKRFSSYLERVKVLYERDAKRRARWDSLPPHVRLKRQPPPPVRLPAFKAGRWKGTDVSSAWLAYRYAIMPLIYTFQDVEKLLKKRLEGSPVRATARAKGSDTVSLDSETASIRQWSTVRYNHVTRTLGSCRVDVRAGVLYEVDASLLTQLGVRWNRVPMAIYEAIPLSFVSDWFHNGASVYDALTAEARSGKILAAWVTTKVKYDLACTTEYGPAVSGGSASGTIGETGFGEWHRRRAVSLADVSFKLRLDMNSKRVADGLALIHTFLSTGKLKK